MITTIISGGQTGADQAGWRAAEACGIPTGGWMPLHFMTENGADSSLGRLCGAKTLPTDSYRAWIWDGASRIVHLLKCSTALLLYCGEAAEFEQWISRAVHRRRAMTSGLGVWDAVLVFFTCSTVLSLSCSIAAKPQWRIGDLNP